MHICTDTLVFVEVKLRTGTAFGDPLEAVTPRKQATIRSLAEQYLVEREPEPESFRLDVVGITLHRGAPQVVHLKDAF